MLLMSTLSNRALNRALLARQMLLEREPVSAVDAIARLVGMQAQVPRPPFVGLWTRLRDFKRSDLTAALHARTVVRVTLMRGTLHVMTAADYVALRGALQPMLTARRRNDSPRPGDQPRCRGAGRREGRKFFGKSAATFDALRVHLKVAAPNGDERAMAYTIRTHVPLVQVPTDAQWAFPAAAEFTLADKWLSKKVPTTATKAEKLVLRYLAAFGPATPSDAQAWSGMAGLRDVFESLRPSLVTFRDGRSERELFDLPNAPRPDEDNRPESGSYQTSTI